MSPILLPLFVQVILTFAILFILGFFRVGQTVSNPEVKKAVRAGRKDAYSRTALNLADNLTNQFEMPVLFYVGVVLAVATGTVGPWMVNFAWAYVALRILHAAVHCTVNIVPIRFAFYLLSNFALIGLWWSLGAAVL